MQSLLRIFAGVLWVLLSGAAQSQSLVMTYDEQRDLVSIKADGVLLEQLASRLTEVTGIDADVDPVLARDQVSVHLVAVPLDRALRQTFRRYSYLIRYGQHGNSKRISSVALLPKGKPADFGITPAAAGFDTAVDGLQYQGDARPAAALDPINAGTRQVVPTIRYLDDYRPEEQVQLSEVERAALPTRPSASAPRTEQRLPVPGSQPASDTAQTSSTTVP